MRSRAVALIVVVGCIFHGLEFCCAQAPSGAVLPVLTNILQFDQIAEKPQGSAFAMKMEGVVCWAATNGSALAFQDESGAALVETEFQDGSIRPGQRILIEGEGSPEGNGADISVGGRRILKTGDSSEEKSAEVFLKTGKIPICVSWLRNKAGSRLDIHVQGPKQPRQKISDSVFWRRFKQPDGIVRWVSGLDYAIYEGQWSLLPDFRRLAPSKTGAMANFELPGEILSQPGAVRFSGYLEVPQEGLYRFSAEPSGDTELSVGLPRVSLLGNASLPAPQRITPGQVLRGEAKSMWAEAEGLVMFMSRKGLSATQLELASDSGRLLVEVEDGSGIAPEDLLESRVRVRGICHSAMTLGGDTVAGVLWTAGAEQVSIIEPAFKRWQVESTNLPAGQLPVLTTLEQIMRLKRDELTRGYPARIRGVVIWSGGNRCQIVDSTAGIYVDAHAITNQDVLPLRAGEYWEIEGVTEQRFSPIIFATRAQRIGLGAFPEPTRASMDQLLNGSLDAQYIEIEGVVAGVRTNCLTMLTRGGKIETYFVPPLWEGEPSVLNDEGGIQPDWSPSRLEALKSYEGALVRVRGSLSPVKNNITMQFKVGEIQIRAGSICVERPAPSDPFSAPHKRAAELLMFDPQADPFQAVRITGQILQQREGECFLMDGNQGLRVIPKQTPHFAVGDLVEVVGLPLLGGPSPLLREAQARRVGVRALPTPQRLLAASPLILNASYDSTRVELQAQLVNMSADRNDNVLGLQMGPHFFAARVDKKNGTLGSLRVGSLVDVTGVFVGRGRAPGPGIETFELLLNSASDIRVLAQPSWWTLKRLAIAVSVLLGLVGAAAVWIGLLRRQVEQRTVQLRGEIQEREHAQHQRALESERSRIARDLHDDLGSSLTEISLLADAGPGAPPTLERADKRFGLIAERARGLVHALDVIVWLINPKKDSLPFLASYLGSYAEEYLSASAMACRLKIPMDLPAIHLGADTRHSIFLAVKESLHNAVRHARASEVTVELSAKNGALQLSIADNGCGFDPSVVSGGNGLGNLRERLQRMGGRCEISSQPGKGTTISMAVPL